MALKEKISVERALEHLAAVQFRHYKKIIVAVLLITAFMGYGLTLLQFQGDLTKEMPQDLPVYELANKLSSKFTGQEFLVIAVTFDDDTSTKGIPRDIRDPRVIKSVLELHERLATEPGIASVRSIAPVFQAQGVPDDIEGVKEVIAATPGAEQFFNRDYSVMLIYADTAVGTDEEKVTEITAKMQQDVDAITRPAGVTYKITGIAPIIVKVVELLKGDIVITTLTAGLVIFALLVLLERSFSRGFIVFLPLIFTVVWTFGTLGFLDISISVTTGVIGAILLGLGVEYGVFMVSRYYEERQRYEPVESIKIAVSNIGASTFGSGATTAAAFFALTLSVMPMIQHLGQTLALGIAFCWLAATVVNPCFILLEERIQARKVADWLHDWVKGEEGRHAK
ncbi:MAG: MMPL family transporter [Methanomicrobia archaeon]|nr:MMPL family transporter [Methanomicrobia archaeon]